jgi:PAS domain-containing protein
VPDPCAFLITNGSTILNANNAFLALTAQTRENLLGSLYTYFIPEVYRDIHRTWAATFIEKVEDYEGKAIGKCLSVGSL